MACIGLFFFIVVFNLNVRFQRQRSSFSIVSSSILIIYSIYIQIRLEVVTMSTKKVLEAALVVLTVLLTAVQGIIGKETGSGSSSGQK